MKLAILRRARHLLVTYADVSWHNELKNVAVQIIGIDTDGSCQANFLGENYRSADENAGAFRSYRVNVMRPREAKAQGKVFAPTIGFR